MNNQAFAWNPSIRGGKAEDTVILRDGDIEWLTATPELPVIECQCEWKELSGGRSACEVKQGAENRGQGTKRCRQLIEAAGILFSKLVGGQGSGTRVGGRLV